MKKSNFLLEGLDSTLFCTVKSQFGLFFQVILIFFNLHKYSLQRNCKRTPKHKPSQPINRRGIKKPSFMFTALSNPSHSIKKIKNKLNGYTAKDNQLNKDDFELKCEAFFFSFFRHNIGDFYFEAAHICQYQKIDNYVNFSFAEMFDFLFRFATILTTAISQYYIQI